MLAGPIATTLAATPSATGISIVPPGGDRTGLRFPHRTGKDYLPPGYYTMEPKHPNGWLDDLHLCLHEHDKGPHSSPGLNCNRDGTCR